MERTVTCAIIMFSHVSRPPNPRTFASCSSKTYTIYSVVAAPRCPDTFHLVGEMAGRNGTFHGYVKPFFENLTFKNVEDKEKNIGARIWERVVAAAAWVVKDESRDQIATRIPFDGEFGDTKIGVAATISNLFRHGFVRAFHPTLEGSVHADPIDPNGKSKDDDGNAENPRGTILQKTKGP